MTVSRVNAGLKRARVNGKTLGRPKIAASTEASITKALAKEDRGILKIAAEFGVGSVTVQRIKAEMLWRLMRLWFPPHRQADAQAIRAMVQ
jgi:DNA invertase Pin-like site-specific DNA recombinase